MLINAISTAAANYLRVPPYFSLYFKVGNEIARIMIKNRC